MINTPDVLAYTVAVCTHNHRDHLEKTLRELHSLQAPERPYELLIIDNASSDGTAELLQRTDWRQPEIPTRVVREPQLGVANARNRAVTEAQGEYLVFIDDDENADPQWLRTYEQTIQEYQPDCLGGPCKVEFENAERPSWVQDDLLGFLGELDHGQPPRQLTERSTLLYTGNCGYKLSLFDRVGLFDSELGRRGNVNSGGEDTDMYKRILAAGGHIRWMPDAVIQHRIRGNKLHKSYFYELHYRQGRNEGRQKRGSGSRIPPKYLIPQLGRALKAALVERLSRGGDYSVRKEMNLVYFIGYIRGWVSAS